MARAEIRPTGANTSSSTKSVVSPAANQSGPESRSRSQRCNGPKITTSIAASSRGKKKLAITRIDSSPKATTRPMITPSDMKRAIISQLSSYNVPRTTLCFAERRLPFAS